MPKPGPRPYECVRRAWHSDRHQPMRGSIIQQVFRVVTESHSSITRKNREWQEKLPRVVLKAEEIMYSKANSEVEYTDPDTLWERVNDAINTIIRRDESTETGQFLPPCIEAALVLACVPVRASRSQRHSNPRSYLNPRFLQPVQAAPMTADGTNIPGSTPQPAIPSGNQPTVSRSTTGTQSFSTSHVQPSFPRTIPSMTTESNTLLSSGSVCPLYYGSHFQNIESQYGFPPPRNPNPKNIIIGTPVGWNSGQPSHFSGTRNLLPDESEKLRQVKPVVSGTTTTTYPVESHQGVDTCGNVAEKSCDLSLRLGPSDPCTSVEKGLAHINEDSGSSSCHYGPCAKNLELGFFPQSDANNNPSESRNDRLKQEGEFQDKNATTRKCKAPDAHALEDGCIQWLTKLQPGKFGGQSRWPDKYQKESLVNRESHLSHTLNWAWSACAIPLLHRIG